MDGVCRICSGGVKDANRDVLNYLPSVVEMVAFSKKK